MKATTEQVSAPFDAIPSELRDRRQWVLWKLEGRNGDKPTKVPYQPGGRHASSTDPATWSTFDTVIAEAKRNRRKYKGIGYVFAADDPYCGVDLDNCRNPETGELASWARRIVADLRTYAEISPSKTGVKLWARGTLPTSQTGEQRECETGKIEAYHRGRYFAVTGLALDDTPINDRQEQITALWQRVFRSSENPGEISDADRCWARLETMPDSISGERGHDKMLAACCEILRHGIDGDDAWELIERFNREKCDPIWSRKDLEHKWESANTKVLRGREFGVYSPSCGGFDLESIDLVDFLALDLKQEFLVKDAVVAGEHLIIGGQKKTLKTSITVDLALSLASGQAFLGKFETLKRTNALVISGESGRRTLQQTCRRIIGCRGITPQRGTFRFSFKKPQLVLPAHLAAVRDEIERGKFGFCAVDPAYLCAKPNKGETSNVFDMGEVLGGFGEIGEATGCTVAIVHHATKASRRNGNVMPDLDDLSGSGFSEWARQWILINRRADMNRGRHSLAVRIGGSAGHDGEYAIDVDEGQPDDPLVGRRWTVDVRPWDDARKAAAQAKEHEKTMALALDVGTVRSVLLANDNRGMSKSAIRDKAGFNTARVEQVISAMLTAGDVEACDYVTGNHKPKPGGYRLATEAGAA